MINPQMLQGMSLPPWFLGDALPLLHHDDRNPNSQFEGEEFGAGIENHFFPPMMNEQLLNNQYYPYHDIGQMIPQMVPLMNYGGQGAITSDGGVGMGIPQNVLIPEQRDGPGRVGNNPDPRQVPEKTMKLDLQIPSDWGCIAFLMGTKGVKLREIEAASGCLVIVPKLPQKVKTSRIIFQIPDARLFILLFVVYPIIVKIKLILFYFSIFFYKFLQNCLPFRPCLFVHCYS